MKLLAPKDSVIKTMDLLVSYLMLSGYSEEEALIKVMDYLDYIDRKNEI